MSASLRWSANNNIMEAKKVKKVTPAKRLTTGDMAVTTNGSHFPKGTVVKIIYDDKSTLPYKIARVGNESNYEWAYPKDITRTSKSGKQPKEPKVNFILQYMLDEDPWETFETIEQVKVRINELVHEEEDLQIDSFIVYSVSAVKKLKVAKSVDISGL